MIGALSMHTNPPSPRDHHMISTLRILACAVGTLVLPPTIAACSTQSKPTAAPTVTVTAPQVTVTATPASTACPAVMAAVRRTAKAMNIDLTTGSMNASLNRTSLVTWFTDLLNGITAADWQPSTPATRRLKTEWYHATLALLKIRDSTTAQTFVANLQAIANTCGS